MGDDELEEETPKHNFMPCLKFVKRGVAKSLPEKAKLTAQELETYLKENNLDPEEAEKAESEEEEEQDNDMEDDEDGTSKAIKKEDDDTLQDTKHMPIMEI